MSLSRLKDEAYLGCFDNFFVTFVHFTNKRKPFHQKNAKYSKVLSFRHTGQKKMYTKHIHILVMKSTISVVSSYSDLQFEDFKITLLMEQVEPRDHFEQP